MPQSPTNNIDWQQDSRSFDTVAGLYDAHRPGYPSELVEFILATARLPEGGKILEIGSGSGKATLPFARRGFSLVCVEPGENLAALARQRLNDYPNVTFAVTKFEDWQAAESAFDLVISAQAFHWVTKGEGFPKVAKALKADGHIALFWNMYPYPQDSLFADLDRVYQELAPELAITNPNAYEELIGQREKELAECGYFGAVTVQRFPWSASYSTEAYLGLLNTYSDHLRLSEARRRRLFRGIAQVIERYGGAIDKPYVAMVYVAQKLP